MKYVVEMGSGSMTYIHCCISIGSAIQKLMVGRAEIQAVYNATTYTFQNEESTLTNYSHAQ
jgi:hypothetical protein